MSKMTFSEQMTLPNEILLSKVTQLLSEGHTVTIQAKGRSMFPFITGGRDSVVLQKAASIQTGDIVLANLADRGYILHRIFDMTEKGITLMGDGNAYQKEECKQEDIAGKVVKIIRNARYVDCSSSSELYKVRIWRMLLPIRKYILGIYYRMNPPRTK